ncbi:MAG: hypothetical protein P8171_24380, partial [Candidatus Thiodiazotropha sp.]
LWTAAHGLRQVPANPLFNVRDMIDSSEQLIGALQPTLDNLPFAPADPFEYWLLEESTAQPLALLMSCRDEAERRSRQAVKWIAAEHGDFSFVSPSLLRRDLPCNDGYNPRVHASILESVIHHRSGQNPLTQWLFRDEQHRARPIDGDTETVNCPPLTLDLTGYDAEDDPLIADYIAWKAPLLLMLPDIPPDQRARLEELAVRQAQLVERFYPLFPEIHNKDLLNRARVEARIRSANRS